MSAPCLHAEVHAAYTAATHGLQEQLSDGTLLRGELLASADESMGTGSSDWFSARTKTSRVQGSGRPLAVTTAAATPIPPHASVVRHSGTRSLSSTDLARPMRLPRRKQDDWVGRARMAETEHEIEPETETSLRLCRRVSIKVESTRLGLCWREAQSDRRSLARRASAPDTAVSEPDHLPSPVRPDRCRKYSTMLSRPWRPTSAVAALVAGSSPKGELRLPAVAVLSPCMAR